jgi:DNA-binding beta-propeller fold protein YncE
MRRGFAWVSLAGILLLGGLTCAHSAPPREETVRPVWPDPPAAARIRWVAAFPNPSTPGIPSSSFWRRAFDFVTGEDPDPEASRPPLVRPFGLAVSGGNLLVADPDGRQVLQIRWRTGDVDALTCADRAWSMPLGIAVAADGAVWVADGGAGVVVRHDGNGRCRSIGEGKLRRPSGIAMTGKVAFVVDPPNHAVWKVDLDGTVLGRFGARGTGEGQFNFPTGVAALPDGSLLVVDALNFRVVKVSAEGQTLAAFGEAGDSGGNFARPKAVATDDAGKIYVSDTQNDVVLVYGPKGAFELAVGGPGQGPGQFSLPAGLAVSEGYLFVADSYNRRIGIFELLGGPR